MVALSPQSGAAHHESQPPDGSCSCISTARGFLMYKPLGTRSPAPRKLKQTHFLISMTTVIGYLLGLGEPGCAGMRSLGTERGERLLPSSCALVHIRGRMGLAVLGGTGRCIPVGSHDGIRSTPQGGGGNSSSCPCGQSRTGQTRELNQRRAVVLGCMGTQSCAVTLGWG